MAFVQTTLLNGTGPYTWSVKKSGDATERFGSYTGSGVYFTPDSSGFLATYTVSVTDGTDCTALDTVQLACPQDTLTLVEYRIVAVSIEGETTNKRKMEFRATTRYSAIPAEFIVSQDQPITDYEYMFEWVPGYQMDPDGNPFPADYLAYSRYASQTDLDYPETYTPFTIYLKVQLQNQPGTDTGELMATAGLTLSDWQTLWSL